MRDEGLRLKPYRDPTGNLTIGYGHNLDAQGITKAQADQLLDDDLNEVVTELAAAFPWLSAFGDARFAVLANMSYNMGLSGLLMFERMFAALRDGDCETAACEMLQSRWARQVGDRAVRLAEQMRTGVWQ